MGGGGAGSRARLASRLCASNLPVCWQGPTSPHASMHEQKHLYLVNPAVVHALKLHPVVPPVREVLPHLGPPAAGNGGWVGHGHCAGRAACCLLLPIKTAWQTRQPHDHASCSSSVHHAAEAARMHGYHPQMAAAAAAAGSSSGSSRLTGTRSSSSPGPPQSPSGTPGAPSWSSQLSLRRERTDRRAGAAAESRYKLPGKEARLARPGQGGGSGGGGLAGGRQQTAELSHFYARSTVNSCTHQGRASPC